MDKEFMRRKILVIDDDFDMLTLMMELLERTGANPFGLAQGRLTLILNDFDHCCNKN